MSTDPPQSTPQAPASIIVTDDRLTYPPFPAVPEGVTITPFKDFKERGIQLFATTADDNVERDGLGLPTVPLRVPHDTDECKTETKRKSNRKAALEARSATGVRREWWEIWMEGEDLRGPGAYNPHISDIDRLYAAANDFRKDRTWPPPPTGIMGLWEQIRLYIGLLAIVPIWERTDKPRKGDDSDNDDEDELEQESTTNLNADLDHRGQRQFKPRPRPRPPYAMYGVEPTPVASDNEVKALLDEEHAVKSEKVITFLNDPEEGIKILLSSYMRKQGFVWHKPNLVNLPRLVGFFIRYLIRNRALPESYDRALRRCADVADRAQNDLPLTAQIAMLLPDDFSESCKTLWGSKVDSYKPLVNDFEPAPAEADEEETDSTEPKSKKPKLDVDTANPQSAVEKFEEELKAANVEVIKVDEDIIMKDALLESIKDNADGLEITATDDNSWGNWGSSDEYNPASFTSAKEEESDPWAEVVANWGPAKVYSLTSFLGPTALPLTHTTGIVEWSVRRVKSFTLPPPPNTVQKSPVSSEEDADAVDIELERHLAKVVLEPWLGWDKAGDEMPHLSKPRILESSRGPVVGVDDDLPVVAENAPDSIAPIDGLKPHNPYKDDITILVEPKVLDALSVGLGIGATWVQIAREQDFAEGAQKKKKKKSKAKKIPQRYWYVEEVLISLPGYYT